MKWIDGTKYQQDNSVKRAYQPEILTLKGNLKLGARLLVIYLLKTVEVSGFEFPEQNDGLGQYDEKYQTIFENCFYKYIETMKIAYFKKIIFTVINKIK